MCDGMEWSTGEVKECKTLLKRVSPRDLQHESTGYSEEGKYQNNICPSHHWFVLALCRYWGELLSKEDPGPEHHSLLSGKGGH